MLKQGKEGISKVHVSNESNKESYTRLYDWM